MPVRRHQPPAAVALLAAEEAAGLEPQAAEQPAEAVVAGGIALPFLQLLAFGLPGGGQLLGALHLFRPVAAAGLAEAVDDAGVGAAQLLAAGAGAEAGDEDVLRRLRFAQVDTHRADLAAVQFAFDAGGDQQALAVEIERHRHAGAHAEHLRRRRLQRHQQGLRRAGGQRHAGVQAGLAVDAIDVDFQGQRPVHGVLDAQAHAVRLGPVPAAAGRCQAQGRLARRAEVHAAQDLAFRRRLGGGAGQVGILGADRDHGHGLDEVEQRFVAACGPARGAGQREAEQQRQMPAGRTHATLSLRLAGTHGRR
ncbi:hypothetical protein D3C76_908800 [compost metagenome]